MSILLTSIAGIMGMSQKVLIKVDNVFIRYLTRDACNLMWLKISNFDNNNDKTSLSDFRILVVRSV